MAFTKRNADQPNFSALPIFIPPRGSGCIKRKNTCAKQARFRSLAKKNLRCDANNALAFFSATK